MIGERGRLNGEIQKGYRENIGEWDRCIISVHCTFILCNSRAK